MSNFIAMEFANLNFAIQTGDSVYYRTNNVLFEFSVYSFSNIITYFKFLSSFSFVLVASLIFVFSNVVLSAYFCPNHRITQYANTIGLCKQYKRYKRFKRKSKNIKPSLKKTVCHQRLAEFNPF